MHNSLTSMAQLTHNFSFDASAILAYGSGLWERFSPCPRWRWSQRPEQPQERRRQGRRGSVAAGPEYEDVKFSGIRRAISKSMHNSLTSMAQPPSGAAERWYTPPEYRSGAG